MRISARLILDGVPFGEIINKHLINNNSHS